MELSLTHHNRFKIWWVEVAYQPIYPKIFRMLNFINKRMKTVAAKINNKKVIYDGAFLRKQLTAKSRGKKKLAAFNQLALMKYRIE